MNILRLQDNPIVAKLYLLFISLAAMNYLFLAFGSNPLGYVLSGKSLQFAVYLLIGLAGLHFFVKTFDLVTVFPSVGRTALSAVKKAKTAVEDEIDTLENFRYGCGCGL